MGVQASCRSKGSNWTWPLLWWCHVSRFQEVKSPIVVSDSLLKARKVEIKKKHVIFPDHVESVWYFMILAIAHTKTNISSNWVYCLWWCYRQLSLQNKHTVWESETPVLYIVSPRKPAVGQGQSSGSQFHRNADSINISGGFLLITSWF